MIGCYSCYSLSISLHMKGFTVLPFLFHLFIAAITLKDCSAIDTVTITEPLQDPSFLVSSNKTFKLGFFSPENTTKRYVGIMYNVPKMPVLWVANRNNPLNDPSGVLTVSEDGNLVVLNGKKEILWSSDAGDAVPGSTAQLLDNGNLVLGESSNRRSVWESFQIPTDCMVTGMRLGGSRNGSMRLTSWRNPSDPSVGNFSFGMDPLRMPEFFIWNGSQPYWRSGPWNGNVFIGVPGMSSAYENRFELVDDNMGSVYFTHAFLNDSVLFYYELSSSGVLVEKMSYFGTDVSKLTWSSLKNECDVYGKCGPFGICNNRSTPICTCLQGFEPRERMDWDRGNWVGGCSRKAMLQCDGNDTKPDGFLKLNTVKVPDFGNLLDLLKAPTEEECGNQCLRNCSCTAFSYNKGIGCMHWSGSLLDIQQFTLDGADLNVRNCSAIDTISATQPLHDPNFIVSFGGTYKLGFFSPENSTSRYVGIMFNVPKMRSVWVANRDKPLNQSAGVVMISEDGNLVVLNGKKEIVWSSNATAVVPNSTAQLLDNGNLVLRESSSGKSVWESFQIPTDTFLPGMKHGVVENRNIQQTSWTSPSDPSAGSFTSGVDPSRIPELFVWNKGVVHWRSGPWDGNVLIGIPIMGTFGPSRVEYLVRENAGTMYFTYYHTNTASLLHYQLTSSGDIQHMVFNEKGDWTVISSSITSECDVYGKCGPNGICDPKGSPVCSCLKGFEPKDEQEWTKGNWTGGCIRKAILQCPKNSSAGLQGEVYGYLQLKNVKVPDLSNTISASEEECGDECLKNYFCSAFTFVVGIGCLHWTADLIDVQQFSRKGSDFYLRVAHSELEYARSNLKNKAIIATPVTVGASLFLAVSLYILCNWRCKHRGGMSKSEYMFRDSIQKSKLEELPFYSYETIANATENFNTKNKLGEGGFGSVYKGELVNGQAIAVKRLSSSSSQGMKEFMNEVRLISKLQHRNLVRLLGCCVERDEKMLVYEYLPNKSLDAYIYDSREHDYLDWNQRLIIIKGISRSLLYLHRDSRLRIIHRDLKASNILLDEDLNPKISDFGLARTFGGKQDQAKTNRIVGTYGYMAPEYAMGGKFSEKSDVYSFGVLLLEIVSGKKNSSFYLYEENLSLLGYVWKWWNENETANLAFVENVDPSTEMGIQRCIQVGLLCVQESADDRPNMFNVLLMLNSELGELPRPKLPAYSARLSLLQDQCLPQRVQSFNDVSLTDVEGR